MDRLATHPYSNGGNASAWASAHSVASGCGKQLWMTEYYEGSNSSVYNALVHGQVSAYVGWGLFWIPDPILEYDYDSGTYLGPNQKYYLLKQFSRYVRPGAVRIDASSNDAEVLVTAFWHDTQRTVTLVMINSGATDKTVNCSLNNLSSVVTSLSQYRTSSTENCEDQGPVSVSAGSS